MIRLVIDMDIGALDIWQALKLDLQFLGYVVGSAERGIWVHDDVYFDDEAGPAVVCADGVDLEYVWGVRHCFLALLVLICTKKKGVGDF